MKIRRERVLLHSSYQICTFFTRLAAMNPPILPRPRNATFLSAFELYPRFVIVNKHRVLSAPVAILDYYFKTRTTPAAAQLDCCYNWPAILNKENIRTFTRMFWLLNALWLCIFNFDKRKKQ